MAQEVINVGATPNDGQGDPIRTAFVKTNTNFSELYSRVQSTPPLTLVGTAGDEAGMYAYDSTYFYYCFADYDGSSVIWNFTADGNISQLSNGTSNISVESSGNVRIAAGGTSNTLVINSQSSLFAGNLLPATVAVYSVGLQSLPWSDVWAAGNVNATYFVGDGSQLTGISTSGNSISLGSSIVEITGAGGNVLTTVNSVNITTVNTVGLTVTGTIIASGNITGGNLNTADAIVATGNVLAGNLNAVNSVVATTLVGTSILGGAMQILGDTAIGGNITVNNAADIFGNVTGANLATAGNVTAGNLTTTGTVVSSGNIRSANSIIAQGTVEATGDIITSGSFIGTFVGNVTGNFVVPGSTTQVIFNTSGNADAVGGLTYNKNSNTLAVLGNVDSQIVNASGNITSQGYFLGNGSQLTGIITSVSNVINGTSSINIPSTNSNVTISINGTPNVVVVTSTGANIAGTLNATGNANVGNLGATNIVGTLTTASQTNITSVGNLSSLTVTGNISTGNISGTTGTFTNIAGTLTATAQNNITSVGTLSSLTVTGNISAGNVSGTNLTGTLATAAQTNITSVGNLSALTVTGNISAGNIAATSGTFTTVAGTLTTGSQPSLTQIGILSALAVSGNANTGPLTVVGNTSITGNLAVSGNINVTGNLNYQNVTDLVVGDPLIYLGANNVGDLDDLGFVANWDDGVYQHGGLARDATDGIWKLFGNVIPEPTTVIDFTNAIYQPLQTGVITTTGLINGNANGVGNIGNSTGYFNTLFASATSAQYADLAEVYIADAEYVPGTVLSFGGTLEVTITTQDADPSIAGVVSTNPAYLMNAGVKSQYTAIVALVGQVPCKVKGNIRKGQMLVSAGDGYARAEIKPEMGTVIGKALEDFTGDQGIIKVVVGRL
jgi:hypothetical protein